MSVTFSYVRQSIEEGVLAPIDCLKLHDEGLWIHGPLHNHVKCAIDGGPCDDWLEWANGSTMGICEHTVAEEDACGCRALNVNVSNSLGAVLLEMLGHSLAPDYIGHADPRQVFMSCALHAGPGVEHGGVMERLARLADYATHKGYLFGWS